MLIKKKRRGLVSLLTFAYVSFFFYYYLNNKSIFKSVALYRR